MIGPESDRGHLMSKVLQIRVRSRPAMARHEKSYPCSYGLRLANSSVELPTFLFIKKALRHPETLFTDLNIYRGPHLQIPVPVSSSALHRRSHKDLLCSLIAMEHRHECFVNTARFSASMPYQNVEPSEHDPQRSAIQKRDKSEPYSEDRGARVSHAWHLIETILPFGLQTLQDLPGIRSLRRTRAPC
jgi:hypothetical protein